MNKKSTGLGLIGVVAAFLMSGCGDNSVKNVVGTGGNELLAGTSVTYEAENATLTSPAQKNTNHQGYSGTGFVDGFYNKSGGQVAFSVPATAQSFKMTLRYSAGNGTSTSMALFVNNVRIKTLTCNATANWDTWADVSETITLGYTTNQIVFKSEANTNKVINLDYLKIETIAPSPTYTITASAGTGGSISPNNTITVNSGASQTFTITPNNGYKVSDILLNGFSQGPKTTFTISNVTANHIVSVSFVPSSTTYTITASAQTGGTISPSGTITASVGSSKTFTITPTSGYQIDRVTVDGLTQGAVSTYTFSYVSKNSTIVAYFKQTTSTYTISASAGNGGSISPSGNVTVTSGGSKTFTINPTTGYQISDVKVDGNSQGAIASYTFGYVTSNRTITASFAQSSPSNVYEAENAALTSPAQKNTNHSGYSGTGFVDGFYNKTGGQVAFTVSAVTAGNYKMTLRYSAGNGTSTGMALYVGSTRIKAITCNATNNWDTWADLNETVSLAYGSNQIIFKNEATTNKVINLDKISLTATATYYTVTYYANGATSGSVPTDPNTYSSGAVLTILPNKGKLISGTKTFKGWNSKPTGDGNSYKCNSTVYITTNFTLYAMYADNQVMDNSGNTYSCVPYGTKKWININLKTTVYNDGTPIPQVTDNTAWGNLATGAYCWQENNSNNYDFGALYNWYAVNSGTLAPAGYHVATQEEWNALTTYCLTYGQDVGCVLKASSPSAWNVQNCGRDQVGFGAYGNGWRTAQGFEAFRQSASWWTSTPYQSYAGYAWYIIDNGPSVNYNTVGFTFGYGVRCVKD